jgi:DNA-binding NarL/FixJ family response regulator
MDFKLPDRDGNEVIAGIRSEFPDAKVVLLSIFEHPETI